jgi:hypothetical protein
MIKGVMGRPGVKMGIRERYIVFELQKAECMGEDVAGGNKKLNITLATRLTLHHYSLCVTRGIQYVNRKLRKDSVLCKQVPRA